MQLLDKKQEFETDPSTLSVEVRVALNKFFSLKRRREAINLAWVAAKRGDLPAEIMDDGTFTVLYERTDGSLGEANFQR